MTEPAEALRLEAIHKMRIRPGDSVLEVGVGTGINLSLYPRTCNVTGIDLSSKMLEKAQKRIDKGLDHCEVLEMNAEHMTFPDNSFDVVYAPYVISVVPDPVTVAREMYRVFNMGIGMCLVVAPEDAERIAESCAGHGERPARIGRVVPGEGVAWA